jgi:hypothetical protein
MDKKKKIKSYIIIFIVALVIIIGIFFFYNNKEPEKVIKPKDEVFIPTVEKIDLKLHYDFEEDPELFEFKDYWNNHKLIKDKSGFGNNGHLIPYDRVYYPEIVQENFKGKALRFENKGELSVQIKDLIAPESDTTIIFYFKPLNNVKYKLGLNEILLLEEDTTKPFPGEIRINIDRNLRLTPSNILSNNSYLVRLENWNSMIITQKNNSISYILNGEKIADYPKITNLNFMRIKPYYVIIDELMVYNGALTEEEISQLSIK